MFSNCISFFKQHDSNESYYQNGGPRSFHHFVYKTTNIILIGEMHVKMRGELAKKYTDIFNLFLKNRSVTLLIEQDKQSTNEKSSDEISFIDSMLNLTPSTNLKLICADKRYFNDKFADFFCFLNMLAKIEEAIAEVYKANNMKPPAPVPFFSKQPEFIAGINMLSDAYEKDYTAADLLAMLDSEVNILDKLHDKYSAINAQLGHYLAECVVQVNDALGSVLDLLGRYGRLGYEDAKLIDKHSLITICIELMKHEETFNPAAEWLHVYSLYETYFLDATLLCDLWNIIQDAGDHNTVLVVTGDAHTKRLSTLLKSMCTPIVSIDADKQGTVITPEIMQEYLNDNFEHAPQQKSCVLM